MSYGDYVEQLTYLLFLKMADERTCSPQNQAIPEDLGWPSLLKRDGDELETHYRHILAALGTGSGLIPVIFRKAQNKIQDPAKLRRLIVDLIDGENWTGLGADVKGDIYEGLLEKNAQDTKCGAGQYFTPRPLIKAIVDVIAPPARRHDLRSRLRHRRLPARRPRLHRRALPAARPRPVAPPAARRAARLGDRGQHGAAVRDEPVPARHRRRRRCQPHPRLRQPGVGPRRALRRGADQSAVRQEEQRHLRQRGRRDDKRETQIIVRDDFWATTSNKQLNFVQHVKTLLKMNGRAAVVVPDNVLFEGGAGETVRRKLLHECDVHTLLRLPTGIFYAQGVKANVLFFDRKPASETPWTEKLWIYDLPHQQALHAQDQPAHRADLDEFVACYNPANRHERKPTWSAANPSGRWRALRLRRADGPRQGQPRHLLAARREPRRQRQPARPRRAGRRDHGRPTLSVALDASTQRERYTTGKYVTPNRSPTVRRPSVRGTCAKAQTDDPRLSHHANALRRRDTRHRRPAGRRRPKRHDTGNGNQQRCPLALPVAAGARERWRLR